MHAVHLQRVVKDIQLCINDPTVKIEKQIWIKIEKYSGY